MPPPIGLIHLSAGDLIAAAGGDPWQVNDGLQAGDAGAINAQADAFHAAAGSATEVEDDFESAKQRFEKGWRHNGAEHPINESAEVTRATTALKLQKPQLAKIALDLETVAAALATAQRSCDADIAALDSNLHRIDDEIGAAEAANQNTQALHDAAVGAVRTALGDVQNGRAGYVAAMASAKSSLAAVTGEAPQGADGDGGAGATSSPAEEGASTPGGDGGAGAAGEASGLTVTKGDVAVGAAGAVAGGTADGVGQATLNAIKESPGTGPGKASQGLLNWLEDPTVGGAELKGFSRLGRVVGGAAAVPAVMSDVHDGNSVAEAVTREGAGVAAGLWAGAETGGLIGSVVPGAGTAMGVLVGGGVGAIFALGASKGVEQLWHPVADAVGSAVHGVESVFGFG